MSADNKTRVVQGLIAGLCLFGLLSCQKDLKNEGWFMWAQKYAEADETLVRNGVAGKETFIEDANARDNAQVKLLEIPAPPIQILDKLLRSGGALNKKVALVNIMLRRIDDKQLLNSVLDTYRPKDETFAKFYAVNCFLNLDTVQLKAFEDRLVKILASEKDASATITALPILIQLDRSKTHSVFINYLKDGTDATRATTIVSLAEKDPDMFNNIRSQLESEGVDIWAGLSKWRLPERLDLPRTK